MYNDDPKFDISDADINARIGMKTAGYVVLRYDHMEVRNRNLGRGRIKVEPDPVYICQCTNDPTHPLFERKAHQIDSGVTSGCKLCRKAFSQERIHYNTVSKYIGKEIGGALCLRVAEVRDHNDEGIEYVWRCPFCGNEFQRSVRLMKAREKRTGKIDCGCRTSERHSEVLINSKRGTGGYFKKGDPATLRKAFIATSIMKSASTDERPYGRTPKLTGDWATGDHATDVANIMKWIDDCGWADKDGRMTNLININGDYCPENCRRVTRDEFYNNKYDTATLQYGPYCFVGNEANAIIGYSLNSAAYKLTSKTILRKLQENGYSPQSTEDGFVHMNPIIRIFPKYPDDYRPPVSRYHEFLNRVVENLRDGIPTRIFKNWTTDAELIDLGIDPSNPRIIWLYEGNGFRHSNLKPFIDIT